MERNSRSRVGDAEGGGAAWGDGFADTGDRVKFVNA